MIRNLRFGALTLLTLGACHVGTAFADPVFEDAPFDDAHWTFKGAGIQPAEALGRKALRLLDGVATLKIPDFTTGIITYDVLMGTDSPIYTGLRFHGADEGQYEYFYLRPNRTGKADANQYTPVFHGDQGWQIYSGPEYSSEEGYKRGGWNHVEVRIYPDSADVYINGRLSLRIPDLKTRRAGGYVAFSSSQGAAFPLDQVYYANVRYSQMPLARPADMPAPSVNKAIGLVRHWKISQSMPQADAMALAKGKAEPNPAPWSDLSVETNGIANLSRVTARSDGRDVAVARFEVVADKASSRLMRFGYSDAVDIFVNGRHLFSGNAEFLTRDAQYLGTAGFQDAVEVPIERGRNQIVFVVKEGYGGWAAAAEFVDPTGLTGSGVAEPSSPE